MSNDKYHILLVDDDDKIRDLLQKYLIENNYIVSVYICEIMNTITGCIFVLFSLLEIYNLWNIKRRLYSILTSRKIMKK